MIEESNDHNPIFTMPQYTAQITEYDAILGVSSVQPRAAVGTVSASDQDGRSSPAGQVEYEIASGHILGNEQLFNITDPAVSYLKLVIVCGILRLKKIRDLNYSSFIPRLFISENQGMDISAK